MQSLAAALFKLDWRWQHAGRLIQFALKKLDGEIIPERNVAKGFLKTQGTTRTRNVAPEAWHQRQVLAQQPILFIDGSNQRVPLIQAAYSLSGEKRESRATGCISHITQIHCDRQPNSWFCNQSCQISHQGLG